MVQINEVLLKRHGWITVLLVTIHTRYYAHPIHRDSSLRSIGLRQIESSSFIVLAGVTRAKTCLFVR